MDFENYIGKEITEKERDTVNEELEYIFNRTEIKGYISKIHPEIFPEHIGLRLDKRGNYYRGKWFYQHVYDGNFEKGWNFRTITDTEIEKYIPTLKTYYKDRNPPLYHFLTAIS